jgi:hypothetical protein
VSWRLIDAAVRVNAIVATSRACGDAQSAAYGTSTTTGVARLNIEIASLKAPPPAAPLRSDAPSGGTAAAAVDVGRHAHTSASRAAARRRASSSTCCARRGGSNDALPAMS